MSVPLSLFFCGDPTSHSLTQHIKTGWCTGGSGNIYDVATFLVLPQIVE